MSLDSVIVAIDKALRSLFGSRASSGRAPGAELPEPSLSPGDRRHAGALMRINHVGEVCAQALYQGQAVVCRDPLIRALLDRAAGEEVEHLEWTARRIRELDSRVSCLNPFWYSGAFVIGVLAGKCGDHWSLGFLAETERQVGAHLDGASGLLCFVFAFGCDKVGLEVVCSTRLLPTHRLGRGRGRSLHRRRAATKAIVVDASAS